MKLPEEIQQLATELSKALLKNETDRTSVDELLSKIRREALPEPPPDQVAAQERVQEAAAAQRAVALYRTQAKLHTKSVQRSSAIIRRLLLKAQRYQQSYRSEKNLAVQQEGATPEKAPAEEEDDEFHKKILKEALEEKEHEENSAQRATIKADSQELEFVKLRRDAHAAVAQIRAQTLQRFDHEFEQAIAYHHVVVKKEEEEEKEETSTNNGTITTGVEAANVVYEICNGVGNKVSSKNPVPIKFQGKEMTPAYLTWLRQTSQEALSPLGPFACLLEKLAHKFRGKVSIAPLKGHQRTVQKVQEKYGGDYSRIIDLVRGMIVFDNIVHLAEALQELKEEATLVRAKDRLSPRYNAAEATGGYRDVLVNLRIPARATTTPTPSNDNDATNHQNYYHVVAELQLHLEPFLAIKNDQGHLDYELARSIHMFHHVFSHRSFVWDHDTDPQDVEELLRDVQDGIITSLNLDHSNALWLPENQSRLAKAIMEGRNRRGLMELSLKSTKCGDAFIRNCLPDGFVDDSIGQTVAYSFRIGSPMHDGTAGSISADGILRTLSFVNNSLRILDVAGCVNMAGNKDSGDEVAEAVAMHVKSMLEANVHPLPQFQLLNLKHTGLTTKGYSILIDLQQQGHLPLMEILHSKLYEKK